MRFVIILILISFSLYARQTYDFWTSGNEHKEKKIQIINKDFPKPAYLKENDTIRPNIAKDFDENNINLASDLEDMSIKDRYYRYILRGEKDPQIAKDLIQPNIARDFDENNINLANDIKEMPIKDRYYRYYKVKGEREPTIAKDFDLKKIKLAPDYREKINMRRKAIQDAINSSQDSTSNDTINYTDENLIYTDRYLNYSDNSLNYTDNYISFQEEKRREDSFIEAIPYITLGNSLFVISEGDYSARVLDDSISASITFDLALNYFARYENIGYLWNINLGTYDFNDKDRTNPDSHASGEISGNIISVMPTVFYELNRAQTMSVLIGYGAGGSFVNLKGNATLVNSNNEIIESEIKIENIYASHGLLIEILHNNLMISFTKVKVKVENEGQNIKINENRLNVGYKFSF